MEAVALERRAQSTWWTQARDSVGQTGAVVDGALDRPTKHHTDAHHERSIARMVDC